MPDPHERAVEKPPDRVLLCLHPECYGGFYLPLDRGESVSCPVDGRHDVVVYGNPAIREARDACPRQTPGQGDLRKVLAEDLAAREPASSGPPVRVDCGWPNCGCLWFGPRGDGSGGGLDRARVRRHRERKGRDG